ncbi:MAG: NupC/NupG family nucleoside CNT transporter, partial [Verrucomicrobiota bacterium]
MLKLISLLGLATLLGVAWALSENRRRFPVRTVLWGLGLQFTLGFLILKTAPGRRLFDGIQAGAKAFLGFADEGNKLVFGALGDPALAGRAFGPANATVLAVIVTGTIIFISAMSSLLYHYGVLQRVVQAMAWVMRRLMGTSGSESLAAAANIFMGQTEAPLVIKPYLARMTRSELMCLMVGGFATIAGGVFAVYTGVFQIPAGHLLTASVMSAPAALLIAKILLPETEASDTRDGSPARIERESINGIDALCAGASDGMKLSLNVLAMLIAFTAVVALANHLLSAGLAQAGWKTDRPLQEFFGYANAPFAFLLGIPSKDVLAVGQILGERIVLNEFIGYLSLSAQKASLDERS